MNGGDWRLLTESVRRISNDIIVAHKKFPQFLRINERDFDFNFCKSFLFLKWLKWLCLSLGSPGATVVIRALKSLLWNIVTEAALTAGFSLVTWLRSWPLIGSEGLYSSEGPHSHQYSDNLAAVTTAHLSLLIIIISNIPICCCRGRSINKHFVLCNINCGCCH